MPKYDEATIIAVLIDPSDNANDLARRHGVTAQTARNWKMQKLVSAVHAYNTLKLEGRGAEAHLWSKFDGTRTFRLLNLSDDDVRDIRTSTTPSRKLAKKYDCSDSMIRMIRGRRAYALVED